MRVGDGVTEEVMLGTGSVMDCTVAQSGRFPGLDASPCLKTRIAHILATDVVDSFSAMREYLREVELCLERVDPHLCNNAGLVARLVDWEESWEVDHV